MPARAPRFVFARAAVALLLGCSVGISTDAASAALPRLPRWVKSSPAVDRQNPVHLDLFDGGAGFALQHGHPLYVTDDYGTTWREGAAPPGSYVADFASARVGYVFTTDQEGRELLRTADGGSTWSVIQKPTVDPGDHEEATANLDEMEAPSENKLLVGGTTVRYRECEWSHNVSVFSSEDAGATFTEAALPFPGVLHHLEMLDEQHGVLLASEWSEGYNDPVECSHTGSESIAMHLMVTHDGGRSWTDVLRESYEFGHAPTASSIHSIAMAAPSHIVLGTTSGSILVTRDEGKTFVKARGTRNERYPDTDPHYLSRIELVEFADASVGYAVSAHGALWRTRDGGLTWDRERSPQEAGQYSFSGGLAVANRRRAVAAAHDWVARRIPAH